MSTHLWEVYDIFLSKLSDYSLMSDNITKEEVEEELFNYFRSARAKFYKCKQDLTTVDNDNGETIFTVKLTDFEIEIIVALMLVEYMTSLTNATEITKQATGDKDFRINSQANQLRELSLQQRRFRQNANKMITEYTFFDLSKENYK